MKRMNGFFAGIALLGVLLACAVRLSGSSNDAGAAIAGGKLPSGYRDWRLISVAREEGDLDDIRAVLGNDTTIEAYRALGFDLVPGVGFLDRYIDECASLVKPAAKVVVTTPAPKRSRH